MADYFTAIDDANFNLKLFQYNNNHMVTYSEGDIQPAPGRSGFPPIKQPNPASANWWK